MPDGEPNTQSKVKIMAVATTAGVGGVRMSDDNERNSPHNHHFIATNPQMPWRKGNNKYFRITKPN